MVATSRSLVAATLACLLAAAPAFAFKPGIHKDISRDAMRTITTTVDGGRTITFTDKAIEEVRKANWRTDIGLGFFRGKNHFTEELFSASSQRLIDLKEGIIADITATRPDGEAARKKLGTAHHTLQDFYAHSNWIERGNTGIFSSLGRSALGNPSPATAVCPGDPEVLPAGGGVILTTGFYSRLFGCGPIQVVGKCYHGNVPAGCDGIHKDSPGRPFHATARDLATQATVDYIELILADPRVQSNDLAKKCLLGVANGSLGVVIDDTGSMGPEISGVRSQVAQIVSRVRGTDDEPKQYLLVRFGDPDVGPPFTTDDPDQFLARVNALSPSGGGDCPELSMTALLQAIGTSFEDSTLFLFTDASAKDAGLVRGVGALATAKNIRISALLTGSCSPIDPAYVDVVERTGGQLFFLNQFEISSIFDLINPQLRDDFTTVLLTKDVISSETRTFSVPVDATMEQAIFSVALDFRTSIEVLDPSGTPVAAGDPDVKITDLSTGRIVTVSTPATGTWQIVATGSGELSVSAFANSPIDFRTFEFVERVNPVHEALAPIPGQPVVGSFPTGLAFLLGDVGAGVDFELLDTAGQLLSPVALTRGDPDAAEEEFVGAVTLPSVPFRVSARGLDSEGNTFQRLFPPVFRAQTVEVGLDLSTTPDTLPAGFTTTLEFTVTNLGSADTFVIAATDNLGLVSAVRPSVVSLGLGESATVEVDVTVPTGTAEGTVLLLSVTASSTSSPAVSNTAAVELLVSDDGDVTPPQINEVTATPEVLWPPNHKMRTVTISVDATDDGPGTPSCRITGVISNEPIDGPGDGATDPDWQITGDLTVELRAERSGGGDGRVYLVEVECTDAAGNSATAAVSVTVPHNQ